ncbi:hypothetical protein OSB04_027386 [Centaurea solstitialis]|uniref:Uncharacterized protein n=1 Tax=Centaurea solstitialis TaxID=347529 RepID=A0AA38SR88_9ASTR|nr:hypothetical protein OSB04_027386 [Centaurea solstitialis]
MGENIPWFARFTMEKGCVHVSGSTFFHICIGLARMQGVVEIMSMADELPGQFPNTVLTSLSTPNHTAVVITVAVADKALAATTTTVAVTITMDEKNITLIYNLDIQKDDFTVKVRIIRLWSQPLFKDPKQLYFIKMILMDEEIPTFKKLLHEGAAIFIKNPTIVRHVSKYKLIDNTNN